MSECVHGRFASRSSWLFVLFVLIGTAPAAQGKPDFSGRWVLESPADPAPDMARSLIVLQTIARTTMRGEPMTPFVKTLTVERQFPNGTRSTTYDVGILGGVAGGLSSAADGAEVRFRESRFSVVWDGDRLVITNGDYSGSTREAGPYQEHTEIWGLGHSDRLVIVVTDESSEFQARTTTLIYQRPWP